MRYPARAATSIARLVAPALLAMLLVLPAPAAAESPRRGPGDVHLAATPAVIRDLGRGPADATQPSGRPYAGGVVLVAFQRRTSSTARAAARAAVQATGHRAVSPLAPDVERLSLGPGVSVDAAVRQLRGRRGVRFVEPDYAITLDHDPGDELYHDGYQWDMEGPNSVPQNYYGSAAAEAWKVNQIGSRDVYVGIVDTGIDIAHRDLETNIWTNPFETPANGIDDDGNGYVDDVHGWDFYHDDASVYDSVAADYHGTHVAGTIGAAGANAEGLVGVNWVVTMIPAKFIDGEGFESGAVAALDYLTDLKTRHGLNIVATNNSWGDPENSLALQDAINRGGDAGILFVAAAGNSATDIDASPAYPASNECDTRFDTGVARGFDCLISVAAITSTGELATFSNYGATSVDLAAPGKDVASTYPGGLYAYLSGTSMAAPHVTGALALLASCQAAPTAAGLRQSLLAHVAGAPMYADKTATGGRLEIGDMMEDCDSGGPPRVTLTARAGGTDTPAQFWVWFSEAVTGLDPSDFVLGGTSTGWTAGDLYYYGNPAGPYVMNFIGTSPTAGRLDVTLPADSVTGLTETGPAAPYTTTTVIDRTDPSVSPPTAAIRTGVSLSGSSIITRLTWTGSDVGTGVRYYDLLYSTNGGSTWNLLGSTVSPSADVAIPPSGSFRFAVRAYDWAGHITSLRAGPTFSPRLVQQSARSVSYSGTWAKGTRSSYSGGTVRYTSVGKRSAIYSFTGRAIAFVTTRSATRGVVRIKLDGVVVARIDLGRSPTAYRYIAWSRTFSSVKAHKVQIVVVGGYGRVDVDAFAVLK